MLYQRVEVIRMWRTLSKLFGGSGKAEAEIAQRDAERSLERAKVQTVQIAALTEKVKAHGRRNHFGERIEAAARRAYP